MNYVDAEIIASTLLERGGKATENHADADLAIIVTCGVRASAEERIVSWTSRFKAENKNIKIVLTGCLSHRKDIESRLAGVVDLFIPIENWITRLEEIFETEVNKPSLQNDFYGILPQHRSTFQAYIPIMTGCNNFCSYCVVPYARGREKSRKPEEILDEVKNLVKNGYKEIYLLGQNVNSYCGIDDKRKSWSFARLLKKIDKIQGDFWIRFISSHPKDITKEMLEAYASCGKVSLNLHLPIQSGSNRILKLMNRKYTREDYLKKISLIREIIPKIVLSTDIIVGFPGETKKDFQDSLDIVKEVGYEMLFSLKYSPRPETVALKMKDDVSAQDKIMRQQKLDKTWKNIAQQKNERFLGKSIIILVDRIKAKLDKKGKTDYFACGKSFDNKDAMAKISDKNKKLIGQWAKIEVKEVNASALKGKLAQVKKGL